MKSSLIIPQYIGRRRASSGYQIEGVFFDGTNDSLIRATNYTGQVDSKVATWAYWYRCSDSAAATGRITSNAQDRARLSMIPTGGTGSTGSINISLANAGATVIAGMTWDANETNGPDVFDGQWHFIMVGVDLLNTTAKAAADGTELAVFSIGTALVNDTVDWTRGGTVGANAGNTNKLEGELAALWFDTDGYLDPSLSASYDLFVDGSGKPIDLGADGSTPVGYQPVGYWNVSKNGAANDFATNLGYGGSLTQNGSFDLSSTSPSD